VLFQARLDWQFGSTLHSFKDSVKNILEVVIQQLRALENLENNLQENGTLSIVYCYVRLNRKQCLVSDLNQHPDAVWLLHNLLLTINHVVIERVHQGISKGVFVLDKHILHAWKHGENDV